MKTMSVKVFTRIACLIMAVAMAVSLVGCGVDITSVGLPTDIVLEKGETQQLNIEYGTDDKAEQEKIAEAASKLNLTWSSSDEEVATVDETGLVTAVGAGEADITVSVADANISSTTHIKVVILPTGVEAPETLSLELNGEATKALGAIGDTDGGAPFGVMWEEVGIDPGLPFEEKVNLYHMQMLG